MAFMLNNKTILIKDWNDMLMKICNFLYTNNKNDFKQKTGLMDGTKRIYLSENKSELTTYKEIENSGIYVETCSDTDHVIWLSKKLLGIFGYDTDLHIETK